MSGPERARPFELYPAIDLRGGKVVRLERGDFGRETAYAEDPMAQAVAFAGEGARWLHVVDLDAARTGERSVNGPAIAAICDAARGAEVSVQCGGGARDDDAAAALFAMGVARVVVGTAAVEAPALVGRLAARWPGRIAVGLDVRGDRVATRGWAADSGLDVVSVAGELAGTGIAAFVVTQITVDGTLAGPDVDGLATVVRASPVPVIASGGVGSLADLTTLSAVEVDGRRLAGAIVGTALYEGRFTLAEALAVTLPR